MGAALLVRLIPYLLVGVAAFGLWVYIQDLESRATVAEHNAAVYEASNAHYQALTANLQTQRRNVEAAAHDRDETLAKLKTQLQQRRVARVAAKKVDPTYAAWADVKLPGVVVRGLQSSAGGAGSRGGVDPSVAAPHDPDAGARVWR